MYVVSIPQNEMRCATDDSCAWAPCSALPVPATSRIGFPARHTLDFIGEVSGPVEFPERFDHRGRVDGDGTVLLGIEDEGSGQGFNVAVEEQSDTFAVPIDDGRAGVAAGRVQVRREV